MKLLCLALCGLLLATTTAAQSLQPSEGQQIFDSRCAQCHGTNGNGGEFAPAITDRVPSRTDAELANLLRNGIPGAGMPAFADLTNEQVVVLIRYLRTLQPSSGSNPAHIAVPLLGGGTIEGLALNRTPGDMQLLGDDHKVYLLRKSGAAYREVTSQVDWTSYNGGMSGSRYSPVAQIDSNNVKSLAPQWLFTLRVSRLQVTPVVVGGIMYVATANECYALDAGNGRQIWHYRRAPTQGITGVSASGVNRGVAVSGDRLFMTTDNDHLLALNRYTGALLWETPMAPANANYNGTGAPLIVDNLVISGTAGGDDGARGFIAAFDPSTGKEVWRFWTVPAVGEPGSETWGGGNQHPGGATWLTGSYDPTLDTLYWAVGNPGPDMDGTDRPGDDLYTDSVVALNPKTGQLKWHFQFTPHDVHDFDPCQTLALIDATWDGQPRKLLVQVNRNGFFYVLDRTNGKFLFGRQFSKYVTWASGLNPEGKPIVVSDKAPTLLGNLICPWLNGAANYYSTSYNPITGLYYAQTDDKCGTFTEEPAPWQAGRSYMNGSFSGADEPSQRILRAFDIHTGKPVWELSQVGSSAESFGGVLSTAGRIVIYGDDSGAIAAADAKTGVPLWSFQTNSFLKASPMTYVFDKKQYVAIAAGSNIIAFALPDSAQ